jgi:hypothetical protein
MNQRKPRRGSASPRSGFGRVGRMKVGHNLGHMNEFGHKDPCHFFIGTFITSPADEMQQVARSTMPVGLGVEYFRDLVLGFAVNLDWRRRIRDWVRSGMEFGTKGLSMETWKTGWTARMLSGSRRQGVRPEAHSGDHLKGTAILLSQFLRGPSGSEELHFDKCI